MTRAVANRLRQAFDRIKRAIYSKDFSEATAAAAPVIEEAATELESPRTLNCGELYLEVSMLLASVARGSAFEGMSNYITHNGEFDNAIERLRIRVGDVETITISR